MSILEKLKKNYNFLVLILILILIPIAFYFISSQDKLTLQNRAATRQEGTEDSFSHTLNIERIGKPGELSSPRGLALSPDEKKLYVVDAGNARIQVIDTTTHQFIDQFGQRGMGKGQLWDPQGIAVSPDGSKIYVADGMKNKVVVFNSTPPYASNEFGCSGNGQGCFQDPRGISVSKSGDIYVVENWSGRVQVFNSDLTHLKFIAYDGGDGKLTSPVASAIDNLNSTIWVSETEGHHYISPWKLNGVSGGSHIGCAPGSCSDPTYYPRGMAIDPKNPNKIYVIDRKTKDQDKDLPPSLFRNRILSINRPKQNFFYELSISSDLVGRNDVEGAVVDSNGNFFAVDQGANQILYYENPSQGVNLRERMGIEKSKSNQFNSITGSAISKDGSKMVVVDQGANRLHIFKKAGTQFIFDKVVTYIGNNDQWPGANFNSPTSVAFLTTGEFLLADTGNKRIIRMTADGEMRDQIKPQGTGPCGSFDQPSKVLTDKDNFYVLDRGSNCMYKFNDHDEMVYAKKLVSASGVGLTPVSATVDQEGFLYIVNGSSSDINVFDTNGQVLADRGWYATTSQQPGHFYAPVAIASDNQYIYVLDSRPGKPYYIRVQVFNPRGSFLGNRQGNPKVDGNLVATFGDVFGADKNNFWYPVDIDAITIGTNHRVIVTDKFNNRVSVWDAPKQLGEPPSRTPSPTPTPCRSGPGWTNCLRRVIPSIRIQPPGSALPCGTQGYPPCIQITLTVATPTPTRTPTPTIRPVNRFNFTTQSTTPTASLGNDKLIIRARKSAASNSNPTIGVRIDGKNIRYVSVLSNSFSDYEFIDNTIRADSKVDIVLIDDGSLAGQKKEVEIDKITIAGVEIQAEDVAVKYDPGRGAAAFDCNKIGYSAQKQIVSENADVFVRISTVGALRLNLDSVCASKL